MAKPPVEGTGRRPADGGQAGRGEEGSERRPTAGDRARQGAQRTRLTFRRLSGLDRSGPPPPETLAGRPLNPWTLPNLIVAVRLLGIPVFLIVAFSSGDGTTVAGAVLYFVLGLSDYLDGITARVTGQYSRLGAIIDPLVDRLLVVAGLVVCWHFQTLPRWAIAALVARELLMVVLARVVLTRGLDLKINWPGRIAVFWTLSAPCWAMLDVRVLALLGLYVGLALAWLSTAMYLRDGVAQLRSRPSTRA